MFPVIRDWSLSSGTFFTPSDELNAAKVAVLGKTAAENLFDPGEAVIGSQVRIKNVPLRVVGVLEPKGQSLQGQDQDDIILLPFSTAERKVLGTSFLGTVGIIFATTAPRAQFAGVVRDIREVLRGRHHLRQLQDDDFTIRTMEDIAKASMATSRTMMIMLLSIASISLLVGGIGIMNILLVSVTERTREIGIRMAIGAKRRHVLLQFLVESLVMTTIGGFAGVITGIISARLLTLVVGWPAILSPSAAVIAFVFSAAVGVLFGLYPANKASQLEPIEALKYE
jgi:putative ABC transport system permease protein